MVGWESALASTGGGITQTVSQNSDVDLQQMLAGLPKQTNQHAASLVWFADGEIVTEQNDRTRAPKFFEVTQIDDPVLQTQRIIQQKLGPYFEVIRAVSFAHRGT